MNSMIRQGKVESGCNRRFKALALVWIALGLCTPIAKASIEDKTAIRCLVGEASGEGLKGMQAVGEVLRRRGTTKGFYGCNASHIVLEPEWVIRYAKIAWERSKTSNITNGATHFEGNSFKRPYWAKDAIVTARIGNQTFYKLKNGA